MPYIMLRAPNVLATLEVLNLSLTDHVKPIVYVSTLSVFGLTRGIRSEDTVASVEGIHLMNGYG